MSKKISRDEAQKQAVESVPLLGHHTLPIRASIIAGTGFGKSRVALRIIERMVPSTRQVYILVPFEHLKQRFIDEAATCGISMDNVELVCYASIHTIDPFKVDTLICDEAHFGLTDRCMEFYTRFSGDIIMFTATLPDDSTYRARLLSLCPPSYTISLDECVRRGYVAPYRLICASVTLTPEEEKDYKTVSANFGYWKGKLGFDAFNAAAYAVQNRRTVPKDMLSAAYGFYRAIRQRKNIVDHAKMKVSVAKSLRKLFPDKRALVFGGDNEFTSELSKAIDGSRMYHSAMNKKEADDSLQAFRDGITSTLVSTKALNQGLDIPDASLGIICGLTSKSLTMIQRIGRLVRIDPSDPKKSGIIVVLYVKDSQEQTWLESAIKDITFTNVFWCTSQQLLDDNTQRDTDT